jgi:hypothetical protein
VLPLIDFPIRFTTPMLFVMCIFVFVNEMNDSVVQCVYCPNP